MIRVEIRCIPFLQQRETWGTRLEFVLASLANGFAGFDARGAKQAGNLLEVQLDGVGAEDFRLREVRTSMAYLSHA